MMQLFLKKPLMSMFLTMFFKTKKHFANDASNDVNRPPLVCRGGQLTLLDRRHDVLRFEEHRQKHRRRWFFKNIASLRKKHNVLHDVFSLRNFV